MQGWKKAYLCELATKKRAGNEKMSVDHPPVAVKGRPPLLGKDLDHQVQAYIASLREAEGVVNTAIVIAAATGIARRNNSNLLAANGGYIVLSKHWAKYMLERMGYVKRKATSKAKVMVENLSTLKQQYLLDIRVTVEMEEIPQDLILNGTRQLFIMCLFPVGLWQKKVVKKFQLLVLTIRDRSRLYLLQQ